MTSNSPTPQEIVNLAAECGYKQRRPSVSFTLFFIEKTPAHGMPPVRINIYPTTRSIMTHLNHPTASTNELWRSNAYDSLEELKAFFENPRIHTGKGYRNAEKAVRGCVQCGEIKKRSDFSSNQWRKGPDANKCLNCMKAAGVAVPVSDLATSLQDMKLEDSDAPSSLTADALQAHNKHSSKNKGRTAAATVKNIRNGLERRQFNCPDCPKHGRGPFQFFKKVPAFKPLVKCPQCKKATGGRCKRLYPIPRTQEKGYGLFKCRQCNDTWGSSRAVADIGQECFTCANRRGRVGVMVTPFRLEVPHKKGKSAATNRRGMHRVPREPIHEDQADEREYSAADRLRNNFSGAGSNSSAQKSYDLEPRQQQQHDGVDSSSTVGAAVQPKSRIPAGYRHKCAGCATGVCKSRKVPKSEVHDVSDGNTVSTSASVVTNSSVDKAEFEDRDEDFSAFFEEGEEEGWIDV